MQPKSRAELAQLYGYNCTRTFTRHLKANAISIIPRKLLCIQAQLMIYACLGIPTFLSDEEKANIQPLLEKYCDQHDVPYPN